MGRPDLAPLTEEILAALTNRGLVKRAVKELAAGALTGRAEEADGALVGEFGGVRTVLPPGGIDAARCTCGASGVCRHVLMLVLAARADDTEEAVPPAQPWSPATFDDDALLVRFGGSAVRRAAATRRSGVDAVVRRGAPPSVVLPTATVTFLSAGDPGLVLCDAVADDLPHLVILAVWSFREADGAGAAAGAASGDRVEVRLTAGAAATPFAPPPRLDGLAERLLRGGCADADQVLVATVAAAAAQSRAAGRVWLADVCDDIVDQWRAYADRSAVHEPLRAARLLAELWARLRAATVPGAAIARIVGADTAGDTRLRTATLTGLGARVRATGGSAEVEVFLAHQDGVLVAGERWASPDDAPLRGSDLAQRRLGGAAVSALAASSVVSQSLSRAPNGRVRFGRGRVGAASVLPVGDGWDRLPTGVAFDDAAALCEYVRGRPMPLLRARLAADGLVVLRGLTARSVRYSPGAQALAVEAGDRTGAAVVIERVHRAEVPGALAALAAAATEEVPLQIAGFALVRGGTVCVDPVAVRTPAGIVVLDLAADPADEGLEPVGGRHDAGVCRAAFEVLAEAAHAGLDAMTAARRRRLEDAAAALRAAGYATAAGDVADVAAAGRPEAWLRAATLLVALEESAWGGLPRLRAVE